MGEIRAQAELTTGMGGGDRLSVISVGSPSSLQTAAGEWLSVQSAGTFPQWWEMCRIMCF